jgi:predicted secreted protein
MKSNSYDIPSSQLDSTVWRPTMAVTPSHRRADDVDCGQLPLSLHAGNPSSSQLFRHLIATALLAAITVAFWLSLIGFAPGADAYPAARTNPAEQPTSATTSSIAKVEGRQ